MCSHAFGFARTKLFFWSDLRGIGSCKGTPSPQSISTVLISIFMHVNPMLQLDRRRQRLWNHAASGAALCAAKAPSNTGSDSWPAGYLGAEFLFILLRLSFLRIIRPNGRAEESCTWCGRSAEESSCGRSRGRGCSASAKKTSRSWRSGTTSTTK